MSILELLWVYCWIFIAVFGVWGIIDGIGSIIIYKNQSYIEHLVRVIRALVGFLLIVVAYAIHFYRG